MPAFPPRSSISVLICCLGVILSGGLTVDLHAARLILPNGDRLTGEVVEQANGMIHFKAEAVGLVIVPAAGAQVIKSEPPQDESASQETVAESLAGLPPSPDQSEAESRTNDEVESAEQDDPQGIARDTPPWKGTIELGFLHQSGRQSRMDISLRSSAERRVNRDQIRASGRILYSKVNERTGSNRYDASLRWRRDLTAGLFGQSQSSYNSDRLKQINHSFEQNVGLGYRLFDHNQHIINVGLGLTGRYRDTIGAEKETVALGEFFEDYTYRINGRFTFTQNALAQISASENSRNTGAHDYKFEFNAALQGKVTDRISMNLRFEYEFDNSIANPTARTDQRVTSSLGYAF